MNQQKLIQAAFKVIAEEGLPEPTYIRYRYPKAGAKSSHGTCHLNKVLKEYHIVLPLTNRTFIENSKGTFRGRKDGKMYSPKVVPFTLKQLTKTMAHEIAHLKFWNHGPQHKSYTEYILSKLNVHLNSDGGT